MLLEDLKQQIIDHIRTASRPCGGIFDTPAKEAKLAELTLLTETSGFWDNSDKANTILKEKATIERSLRDWNALASRRSDLEAMAELASEEGGQAMLAELEQEIGAIIARYMRRRNSSPPFRRTGCRDTRSSRSIPEPAAPRPRTGPRCCMRMYLRWAEKHGTERRYSTTSPAKKPGVKSVTFTVAGDYPYGRLKAEAGVHRLVRISPFDANKRRHTSFASVYVYPEVEDDIDISIDEKDLQDRHLPGVERRRPAREQDRFRGPDHPPPHEHRGPVPERTVTAQEQERGHEGAEIPAL